MCLITKSNDRMKQTFVSGLKCHFNLRRPKSDKPTNIYLVVYLQGRQCYFSTGVKVYPKQWSKGKQMAIVSNVQSELDNINNRIVNDRISKLKEIFSKYKNYLETNVSYLPTADVLLKSFIYGDMKKKEKGTKLLQDALNYYYQYKSKSVTDRTQYYAQSKLDKFFEYIKVCEIEDNLNILSQSTLNNYRDYLKAESEKVHSDFFHGGIETINQYGSFVAMLINEVIVSENDFLKYNIQAVKFNRLPTNRKQEDKPKFPLSEEEIELIKNCQGLKPKVEIYRDIFLLQIECGQRVSDLLQVLKHNYKKSDGYIILKTKKEKTKAYFPFTSYIQSFFEKYKEGYGTIKIDNLDTGETYNSNIKKIANIAGLDRIVNYTDTRNNAKSSKVCDIISSHWARHTFVVRMKKAGYTADEICDMTGHSDDTMIRTVYGHYGDEDKIGKLKKAKARVEGHDESVISNQKRKTNVVDLVFGYEKLMQLYDMCQHDLQVLGNPLTKECRDIILSTKGLSKIIEFCKDKDVSELKRKALELEDAVKCLTRIYSDYEIYKAYEYKLLKFGFIEQMTPAEFVEEIFREPTQEELDQIRLEEYLKSQK